MQLMYGTLHTCVLGDVLVTSTVCAFAATSYSRQGAAATHCGCKHFERVQLLCCIEACMRVYGFFVPVPVLSDCQTYEFCRIYGFCQVYEFSETVSSRHKSDVGRLPNRVFLWLASGMKVQQPLVAAHPYVGLHVRMEQCVREIMAP
jgi:hypothetical protein